MLVKLATAIIETDEGLAFNCVEVTEVPGSLPTTDINDLFNAVLTTDGDGNPAIRVVST